MEPVTVIVAALVGAAKFAADKAGAAAVKDAYEALKAAILHRSKDQAEAAKVLTEHVGDAKGDEQALRKVLAAENVSADPEIVALSTRLLNLIQEGTGKKYDVEFLGRAQGTTIGDGNTIIQQFSGTEEP
jgi:hypothetical protein